MKRDDKSPDDQKPPAGAESGRRALSSPALDQRVAAYAQANGLEVSTKTKAEALEAMVAAEEAEEGEQQEA